MQGAGNDYVYVDCTKHMIEDINEVARKVSDRHFGIGSDGLVLICPSDKADFRMDMYNSDGTRAEMCGNASRCVGKYVYDNGLTDKKRVTLETLAGIRTLELNVVDGKVGSVRVDMGAPVLDARAIPIDSPLERFIAQPLTVSDKSYFVTGVSMGNPHAVTFVDDVDGIELERIGPLFENHPIFPKRINTEFAEIIDRQTVKMRVWERGAGETLACGTGACATLVAAYLNGLTGAGADIILRGGTLHIEYDTEADKVYMTGPAVTVFDGKINI